MVVVGIIMGLRGRNNGNVNKMVVGIIRVSLLWVYEVEIKGIAYDGGGGDYYGFER